jgi:hypothetical protein
MFPTTFVDRVQTCSLGACQLPTSCSVPRFTPRLSGWWTVRAAEEERWAPIAAGLLIIACPDRDLLQHEAT